MNLQEAIIHALNGNAVVFTGTGFSYKAINITNKEFLMGVEFNNHLCDLIKIEHDDDLKYISDRFIKEGKTQRLVNELQSLLTCKESKEYHDVITSVDWKKVYTTNYDDVFEQSGRKSSKNRAAIDLNNNPRLYYNHRNIVIHLNGFIQNLNSDTLNGKFKLTNVSYLTDDFIHSNWIEMFKQDLDSAKAVIFIGFSLNSDLDLARRIHNYDKSKMFFITSPSTGEKDIFKLSEFGQVHPIGIEEFSKKVLKEKKDYLAINITDSSLYCFDHYHKQNYETSEVTDKDMIDLFMLGHVSLNHVYNKVMYFVQRTKVSDIEKYIADGRYNFIIIESSLGNGKTCFLKSLIVELSKSYHVFLIKDDTYEINNDIDKIITLYEGKKVIMFDNYFLYYNVIKKFNNKNIDDIYFIFAARSYLNDVNAAKLSENGFFDNDKSTLINISKLDAGEIKQVERLLMNYHLWPTMNYCTTKERQEYIKRRHRSEMKNIILDLFENSKIKHEFTKLINVFTKDSNKEKLLLLSIINELVPLNLTFDDICFLINYAPNLTIKEPEVREILNVKNNLVVIESSILAEKLLKVYTSNDNLKLTDFLIEIMRRADEYTENKKYSNLKRLLISSSNIELIFDKRNHKDMIIKYYENIKNLNYCKDSYFFWLQYGIIRLDLKEYEGCEFCFKNAREYIKKNKADKTFDTFQLDTHYARLLIEKLIDRKEYKGSLEAFLQAHKLIVDNRTKFEHWHYPLKIATYYLQYYETFKEDLKNEELGIYTLYCRQVIEKINLYIDKKELKGEKGHYQVMEARNNINKALDMIQKNA